MLRSLLNKRHIMLALIPAIIVAIFVFSARFRYVRTPSCPVPTYSSKISIAWRIRAADVQYMAMSPNGQFFCTIDKKSNLNVYGVEGKKQYTANIDGMDRAIVAPDGSFTVAFSYLNPANPHIVFLDSAGKEFWKTELSGAVWCADTCLADGGARFVIGTGKRSVYVFEMRGKTRRYRWWRAPGAVTSLSIAPDIKSIVLGTWQDSSLARADLDGNKLWQRTLESASLHYIEQLDSPDRLLLRSWPNAKGSNGEFLLMDADGVMLWRGTLDVAADTRVIASPDGRFLCLGYKQSIEHGGKQVSERHAILFDEAGERLWEKGSMFFQADPKLVTCAGEVLLADNTGALFITRRDGSMEGLGKLPAPISRSVVSRDGKSLLVQCADNSISLIKVVH